MTSYDIHFPTRIALSRRRSFVISRVVAHNGPRQEAIMCFRMVLEPIRISGRHQEVVAHRKQKALRRLGFPVAFHIGIAVSELDRLRLALDDSEDLCAQANGLRVLDSFRWKEETPDNVARKGGILLVRDVERLSRLADDFAFRLCARLGERQVARLDLGQVRNNLCIKRSETECGISQTV